jgi:hypothetical protein
VPTPVTARSKAWVCRHSLARVLVSNTAGAMNTCLVLVLCVVKHRYLRRSDHSSRGVLTECGMSNEFSRSPVKGDNVPESGRSATKKT